MSKRKIGLGLSGGGYRAAAFHLGTLSKLNELGLINRIDVLSCISGGSIIGAYLCLQLNKGRSFEEIEAEFRQLLQKSVIRLLLLYLATILLLLIGVLYLLVLKTGLAAALVTAFLFLIIFIRYQFHLLPLSWFIERIYNRFFYKDATLKALPAHPALLINATNLGTGRLWTFSHNHMGDSSYTYRKAGKIEFKHEDFPLARAVASSTCVPFAFSPIKIGKRFFTDPSQYQSTKPRLVDGGVYDNQGIHKLTQPNSEHLCDIIIVSDAGTRFSSKSTYNNNFTLLQRTSDIFMRRIKNLQFQQNIYYQRSSSRKEIAYLSLTWEVDRCIEGFIDNLEDKNISQDLLDYHQISKQELEKLNRKQIRTILEESIGYPQIKTQILGLNDKLTAQGVTTNLTALSDHEIKCLMSHAAVMTEIQVKLYCPSLFDTSSG